MTPAHVPDEAARERLASATGIARRLLENV
jgi:hypothetical protein